MRWEIGVKQVAYRSHTAIAITAVLYRVGAILAVVGVLVFGLFFTAALQSVAPFAAGSRPLLVILVVIGVADAIVLWAIADAFVLIGEGDDAHRRMDAKLDWLTERLERTRDERGVSDSARAQVGTPMPTSAHVVPRPWSFVDPEHVGEFRRYLSRRFVRVARSGPLFAAPSNTAETYAHIDAGDSVAIVGETTDFYYIESPQAEGWLPRDNMGPAAT